MSWKAQTCTSHASRTSIRSVSGPLSNASIVKTVMRWRTRREPTRTVPRSTPRALSQPDRRTKKPLPDGLFVRLRRLRPPQLLQRLPTQPFSAGDNRIADQALTCKAPYDQIGYAGQQTVCSRTLRAIDMQQDAEPRP